MTGRYTIAALLALAAAHPALAQTAGERQDAERIQYFQAHADDRKSEIQACDALTDQGKADSDCILARKADNQAGVDDVKKGLDNTVQGAADFFHKLGD